MYSVYCVMYSWAGSSTYFTLHHTNFQFKPPSNIHAHSNIKTSHLPPSRFPFLPLPAPEMKDSPFASLSDDVVLKIFFNLEEDPRNWSRLACVSTKFSTLIRSLCWRSRCLSIVPAVVADLSLPSSSADWSALHKLAVCCPGLHHSGVLLDNSDFGLERELGPGQIYSRDYNHNEISSASASQIESRTEANCSQTVESELHWSLYDDLYLDTVYDNSETHEYNPAVDEDPVGEPMNDSPVSEDAESLAVSKKRKIWRSMRSHLASGPWSLSREQGNKLLANRFREDTLYICDWPGCIHMEEKRNYMLFRGFFKNFKRSKVWRTINDGKQRSRIDMNCAYCGCKETWDLHSAFCLRRAYGYHDDGEPVVRAYVCENGHVSGAWTDLPLYT